MPLLILAPMVIIGIAGIAIALHFMGFSQRRLLTSSEAVQRAWAREFPNLQVAKVLVASGHHALVTLRGGGCGLVWSMGADTAARPFGLGAVKYSDSGLTFHFGDPAVGSIYVPLGPEQLTQWRETIGPR